MKGTEGSSNLNRRSVLRTMGASATMGSLGLSGAASADINTDEKEVTLSRNVRDPTSGEKDTIFNSEKLEQFVKSINVPKSEKITKVRSTQVRIKELYLEEQKVGETVQIQTKYGEITAPLDSGSLESLVLKIDVDEVPPGRRKQYSGGIGIPTGSSAFITYHGEGSP